MPTYTAQETQERKRAHDALTKLAHDHLDPLVKAARVLEKPLLDATEAGPAAQQALAKHVEDVEAEALALKKLEAALSADVKKALEQLK